MDSIAKLQSFFDRETILFNMQNAKLPILLDGVMTNLSTMIEPTEEFSYLAEELQKFIDDAEGDVFIRRFVEETVVDNSDAISDLKLLMFRTGGWDTGGFNAAKQRMIANLLFRFSLKFAKYGAICYRVGSLAKNLSEEQESYGSDELAWQTDGIPAMSISKIDDKNEPLSSACLVLLVL
jgi:hypothetical protein